MLPINIGPNYGWKKVDDVQSFIVIQRSFARECLLNYRQPLSTMKHYNPNGQPSGGRSDRRARVGRLAAEWREAAVAPLESLIHRIARATSAPTVAATANDDDGGFGRDHHPMSI